ncbi:MAG: hypothetical protein LQ345_006477, partial [Seirophora villosa]
AAIAATELYAREGANEFNRNENAFGDKWSSTVERLFCGHGATIQRHVWWTKIS